MMISSLELDSFHTISPVSVTLVKFYGHSSVRNAELKFVFDKFSSSDFRLCMLGTYMHMAMHIMQGDILRFFCLNKNVNVDIFSSAFKPRFFKLSIVITSIKLHAFI